MNTNKRISNATLSLKLPPEIAKIMPWIISAKASGKLNLADWAKKEYERAEQVARERERAERAAEHRREWLQLLRKQEELERQEWLAKRLAEERTQRARLEKLGTHFALEDGFEEIQPTQSSQKGWRRLLSECPDLCEARRYGMWGESRSVYGSGHYSVKHNCGRKPRKPWFKKTRAQH